MDIQIPQNLISELEALGVGVVYLFGSQVDGTANSTSDVDFGVVLLDSSVLDDTRERLNKYNQLYSILSDVTEGRDVDVVLMQNVPLSVQFQVIKTGKILYEVSLTLRADYEENVIKYYLDFKPYIESRYKAALERIK